ncbi:MAG: oligosaccharide flippase family protein [Bacteroidales bacterium]|nr:oligosaccharide flippase family protein [Bacteroidales bacterium]
MKYSAKKFVTDFFWYLAGTTTTLLVGVLRTPVFTRYFTPEEYGYYGLILITFSILSIFLYGWLNNCIWRFYNQYKKEGILNKFYLNLFLLYVVFSIIFLFIAFSWYLLSSGGITGTLIILVFVQLLVASPLNYMLIVDRLEYRSKKYNIIAIFRVVLSFTLQYLLTFQLDFRIEAIPLASLSIDLIILIAITPSFLSKISYKLKDISGKIIKTLFGYAVPGIISNLSAIIIASSDRYFIAMFGTIDEVGIYNQVYSFSQLSIMALVNVFFAVINPKFLKTLEYSYRGSNRLTMNYLIVFIIFILPVTTYLSMFAFDFSNVFFGKDFRIGYKLIPWVMFGNFFSGLTLFSDNRLKFGMYYKQIFWGYIVTAVVNILLNFFFIPVYTYRFAAVSTLISYSLLMIYFFYLDYKYTSFSLHGLKVLLPVIIVLVLQFIADYFLRNHFLTQAGFMVTGIEVLIFALAYIVTIIVFIPNPIKIFVRDSDMK